MKFPPLTPKVSGLLHGGDYNPEQWPRETWDEDDRLMGLAHWNVNTLGIFSWVSLEPEEGRFTFDWLDEIMDRAATAGRLVGLATPSAAAPAWLSKKYPETLRTGHDLVRRRHGNRVNFCWTSEVYREKTSAITRALAERYRNHPALAYWHVSNELGGECYCERCQAAFRVWLEKRYGSLAALNQAYWTAFWSHTYTAWDQIEAPGAPYGETSVIGLTLDWKRFTSSQIVDFYLNEANVLRGITPATPVTTNLMGTYPVLDPFKIAPHVDFISWDSYPWFGSAPTDINSWIFTSFIHDLNRSLKGGQPFLLMECTPSSSNWYPVMALKRPGAHLLEGMQAVAHGADGVQYFQWRQGRGSSEQFHGAVMAHNNRSDARVFQDVSELGRALNEISDVAGGSTQAEVALLYDWEVCWAVDSVAAPRTQKRDYGWTVINHYKPLWQAGIATDIIDSDADFSPYKLVVAPMLFLLKPGVAEKIAVYVENGGTFVTTYWSGVVDESALAYQGGFPSPLREVLGIWSEEIDALYDGVENTVLTVGSDLFSKGSVYAATDLCELIHAETAEVLATYGSDFYAGRPAVTRNRYGNGAAIYVASRNHASFIQDLMSSLCNQLHIEPCAHGTWPEGVTVQRREADVADFFFVLNCSDKDVVVELDEPGLTDMADGSPVGPIKLPAFGCRVLVHSRASNKTQELIRSHGA